MKKLMVLATVAAMAFGAKADTSLSAMYSWVHFDPTLQNKDNYMDYKNLYLLLSDDFKAWQTDSNEYSTLLDASIAAVEGYDGGNNKVVSVRAGDVRSTWADNPKVVKFPELTPWLDFDWPVDDPQSVVAYTVLMTDRNEYYYADVSSAFVHEDGPGSGVDYLNLYPVIDANNVSAIRFGAAPEPTSGLLLGVAGLALKRKSKRY